MKTPWACSEVWDGGLVRSGQGLGRFGFRFSFYYSKLQKVGTSHTPEGIRKRIPALVILRPCSNFPEFPALASLVLKGPGCPRLRFSSLALNTLEPVKTEADADHESTF